jgi:hypothetical protein
MTINYTTGYAGTGKSTKLLDLLNIVPEDTSVVLAPTHKALARLQKEYRGEIELKTIHSLMGLIPKINKNAQHIGHINTVMNLNKPLEQYTDIIIDEAGMINEEHFLDLVGKIEELEWQLEEQDIKHETTVHLFLDPYQLLPVKGSESLDIVATYTKFVDYLQGRNKSDLSTPYSTNILPFDITKFKEGDRLLAYTNQAVGDWNTKIARLLGIKSYVRQEVQLGSNSTAVVETFLTPTYKELFNAYENGSLKLQNNQINKKFLEQALKALLHKDIGNAAIIHKKAGEAAIKNRTKFSHVYALGRAFIMDYNFASTVHKSQGQEFSTVFVDKEDIQKSIYRGYYMNYARMMYVAISRTRKTLYI